MKPLSVFPAILLLLPALALAEPLPSGSSFMSDTLKARQADDGANPGMLWIAEGAEMWRMPDGANYDSCSSCHGDAAKSMRGVATRYPMVELKTGQLINLEGRINLCRTKNQKAQRYVYSAEDMKAITAFVAFQSRGLPIVVAVDGAAKPFYERGRAFFNRRRGQLNLSCAQCHVENAGKPLRGNVISHGLPNGFPAYRLEWQTLGSLHLRLRACSFAIRAERDEFGSQPLLELELFLAGRAKGVAIETPAIRP
jgi:sulfur-oxidizing protein SoxA